MFSRAPLPLTLRYSPSLCPNNLTVQRQSSGSQGEFRAAYIHREDVVIVESKTGSGIDRTHKMDLRNLQVFTAVFVDFGPRNEHLVVTSNVGVQLWSVDGEQMEWFHKMTDVLEETRGEAAQLHFMRGACGMVNAAGTNCVALGSSVGVLIVANADKGDVLHHVPTISHSPVSALAASGNKYLYSANDDGDLSGFRIDGALECFMRIPGKGDPCICLVCVEAVVVAGYSTGHIRIYLAEAGELAVEVAAHARALSSLCLHPSSGYFTSASEDQCVRIWTLPTFRSTADKDVDLAFSASVDNQMLTGAAWTRDGRLLTVAYDTDEIVVFHSATASQVPS